MLSVKPALQTIKIVIPKCGIFAHVLKNLLVLCIRARDPSSLKMSAPQGDRCEVVVILEFHTTVIPELHTTVIPNLIGDPD